MQSLKSRFNGNSGEVIKYAREFGVGEAMREYQVKDYVAMCNFLKEHAPDETFQYAKVDVGDFAGPDAFDRLLEKMLSKYYRMETALKAKDTRIAELEAKVAAYEKKSWQVTRPIVEGLLNYCEEK